MPSRNLFRYYSLQKEAAGIKLSERKSDKILGRMENSRLFNGKAKILWQLENLQNYEDLYEKPLERDWRAKRLLPIQIQGG